MNAVRDACRFVESLHDRDGGYRIDAWPPVRRRPWWRRDAAAAVPWLRLGQRRTAGFLDPVDDAVFLVAGLRGLGFPATFHLGREIVPAASAPGFFAWAEHDGQVLSTSLPVQETYLEVYRTEPR
jgi:hypothetical protein